jgi:glycosyltransferase involved in cell wall biosynthesis
MGIPMSKKFSIAGIGFFPDNKTPVNGQSLRSESVFNAISQKFTGNKIKLSYNYWRKRPLKTLFSFVFICFNSEIIIIFPDANAIKFLVPSLYFFKKLLKFKIFYVVIGGWVSLFLTKNSNYIKFLKSYNGLFVQTEVLKNELSRLTLNNVFILPNFRKYKLSQISDINFAKAHFVYFSRVTKQKGVDDMLNALIYLADIGYKFYLDIYGPIDIDYERQFSDKIKNLQWVSYRGKVDSLNAPNIISKYFMQIFPTRFATEGFPGSILDSFFAGVPVLASKWNSASEIIKNNSTGLLYKLEDLKDLTSKLQYALDNPNVIYAMRENCIKESSKYNYNLIIDEFYERLISN